MWLAIDGHPGPTMSYDLDMGGMNMRVSLDEVRAEYACKKLRRGDWVLLGFNVDGVLHRISGNYNAIVGFGISGEIVRFRDCNLSKENKYDVSISPSKSTQTVISVTVCMPVFSSRWTLYTRTLSLP